MHEKYSGTVFESTLDGTITGGAIYFNGKQTWKIEPSNIEHVSTKCLVQRNGSNIYSLLFLKYENSRVNYESYNFSTENFSTYCDACGEVLESCSCIRCPQCQESMAYCDCQPYEGCEYCHQDPCKCAICKDCGKNEPECSCSKCPVCSNKMSNCLCNSSSGGGTSILFGRK